jgi:flavin reductase (DIM6/NTAB) family NADH-FMN oxidoreductase RutF
MSNPLSAADHQDETPASEDELLTTVKDVHRHFPTGVTIVTTCIDGEPSGLAVNAFSSISIEPPVVLVCVAKTSATYDRLYGGDHIAVNVLASDQVEVARRFARSGGDKFSEVEWHPGVGGAPILGGVSGYLEIEIETRIPAYTHTIFIGRVVQAKAFDHPPLVYLGGEFFAGEQLSPLA